MKVVIDRFEGDYAVCEKEDSTILYIERSKLPCTAKEGDVLNVEGDEITADTVETEKRKKEIGELTKDIWS